MPTNEEIAKRDWDRYVRYRDDSWDWRESRDRNEKFYFNDQWSDTQGSKLEARGQKDLVINKIRQLLRMRVSMMIANKPMGKVFGTQKGDIETARLLENFADWHLYNSDWQFHLERAVMGQNRCGVHWLSVYDDPLADYARGELKISNQSYRNVFLDKAANAWDFGDAPCLINSRLMRPEDWLNTLPPKIRAKVEPDIKDFLVPDDEVRWHGEHEHGESNEIGTPVIVTPSGVERDLGEWVRISDIYEKAFVDVPVLLSPDGIPFAVGDPDKTDGGFSEDLLKEAKDGNLRREDIPMKRCHFRTSVSGKTLLPLDAKDLSKVEDILPIEDYPIIPIVDEDTQNSLPLGEVDFQRGIQEVYNTCISLTLLNASLSSNIRVLVDSGAAGITDIKAIENQFSVPGAWIDMKTNPVTGEFPIEIVRPEPLTQAWFSLAQLMSQELEFQASRGLSLRSGDPTNAPETFAATLQLGQWAQDILRIPLSRMELGFERLYNVIFQWAPTYYDFEKIFYTFAEDGEATEEVFNFTTKEFLKARFRMRAGSTMPSQTVAELGVMQNLAQNEPALIGAVIDRLPGVSAETKQELKQTIDLVSQLRQQSQGQEEVIKVLQTQMQHLNEQVFAFQRENALGPLKQEIAVFSDRIKQANKELGKTQNVAGVRKKS